MEIIVTFENEPNIELIKKACIQLVIDIEREKQEKLLLSDKDIKKDNKQQKDVE